METTVTLKANDELADEVAKNPRHFIEATVDRANGDIYLKCSTRDALYELGRSLMHEALFGTGTAELYPLSLPNGSPLAVNGARLSQGSSRVFVFYPEGAA